MNTRMLTVLLVVLLSVLVTACGAGASAVTSPETGGSGVPAATSAPTRPTEAPPQSDGPAPSSGMDVSTVDMCSLLTRAELADLAGGTPYEGAESGGPACIYTIDPGDGTAVLYSMSVTTPDLVAPMVDYVRQYEEAEWLEDIGDTAYLQPASFGEGFALAVLVEGKYGLSLSGPRPEVLQDAARLIVERLRE